LADVAAGLRHRQFVRVHLGAGQATAQLLIDDRTIAPGKQAFAVLRTKTPITAEYGQPFVLRQLSPAATIGGGRFLLPALRPADKFRHCLASAPGLAAGDPATRLAAYVELRREALFDDAIESRLGMSRPACEEAARRLVERRELVRTAGSPPTYVTAARFQELKQLFVRRTQIELERRKPTSSVPLSAVLSAMSRAASGPVLDALVGDMTARREIIRRGDKVGLPSGAELSNRQRQMLDKLLAECAAAGAAPPTLKEFGEKHAIAAKDLDPLVQVAVDEGRLVRLSPAMVIDPDAIEALRLRLLAHFAGHATAKVGELREQWGITRKHAVPIFEFFDRCRITLREGDLRSAGPRAAIPVAEANV
jgi:selenocysteine-specific elongation factor